MFLKKSSISLVLLSLGVLISACSDSNKNSKKDNVIKLKEQKVEKVQKNTTPSTNEKIVHEQRTIISEEPKKVLALDANTSRENPLQIEWDDLIPEDYRREAVMKKYQPEIEKLVDLPEEEKAKKIDALYKKIEAKMSKVPANEKLNNKWVELAGFVTPLTTSKNGLITEFLLVPYYGACIHVPPPPTNQTIYVKLPEGKGISIQDSYDPHLVLGYLHIISKETDIGTPGYAIEKATTEAFMQ